MKTISLSFVFLISAFTAFAQQPKMDEVIYLKNGSSKRGLIMEWVFNKSISILSNDSLYTFNIEDVTRITREQAIQHRKPIEKLEFKPKQYVGIVEIGVLDYPQDNNNNAAVPRFSINIVNGYQFNQYVALGLGIGADIAKPQIYDVPVTLDVRTYFAKWRHVPFFALGLGYDAHLSSDYTSDIKFTSGFVANPALGIRMAANKKFAVSISIGGKFLSYNETSYGGEKIKRVDTGATFKLGFHF